jgi:outer membrane lipoprotein-sorting protein
MRKYGIAAVVLIVIVAIALIVRSQLSDTSTASAADTASSGSQPLPVIQDSSAVPAADTIAPDSAGAGDQPPAPRESRPVVSGHIPPLQQEPARPEAEQEGIAVLRRAAAAYANVNSMRAEFVQRRENPLLNSTLTSRGTLYQRSPDRFALRFSQPAGDVIIADGRHFWVYYPSVDRRQVIRATATQGGAGAVDLKAQFIGNPVERFRHTYHGTEKLGGRTAHVLTLVPRNDAGYQSLKVWIDGMDSLVRRFIITEPTGAAVEFQLSNLAVNPNIGNDVFRFTPPADAVIVER